MGYDYSVRGFFTAPPGTENFARMVDDAYVESRHAWVHPSHDAEWIRNRQYHWTFAIVGQSANHVVFGTESKYCSYGYLKMLESLAAHIPAGRGIVLVTGEIAEGRDHMVCIDRGVVRRLPRERLYTPPWDQLAFACHDADYSRVSVPHRVDSPWVAPDAESVRNHLAGQSRIRAFLELDTNDADVELLLQQSFAREFPRLHAATGIIHQYCSPHFLLGEDNVDPVHATQAIVWASLKCPKSAGILLGWPDDDKDEVRPLLVYDGKVQVLTPIPLHGQPVDYPVWNGKNYTGLHEPADAWA